MRVRGSVVLGVALVAASLSVIGDARLAGAVSVPGVPGTPIAVGMQGAAALRWSAPADVGTPPLTGYRLEANNGSGWTTVTPGQRADSITAGQVHSCALLDDGTVKCWGANGDGRLGLGDTLNRGDGAGEMGDSLPAVALGTGRTAVAITAAASHTCALLDNGTVKCWGSNFNGQLGLGDIARRGDGAGEMGDSLPAVALGTGRTAVAVTAGDFYTCALLDDATVKCWGNNNAGQLGLGDGTDRGDGAGEMGDSLPAVALGTGRTAVAVTAGGSHTCALLDDGSVKCWGYNGFGQLGLGDIAGRGDGAGQMGDSLPAIALGTGRTAVALTSGNNHTCALLDDATVKCWGRNLFGQLGLGDVANRGDAPGEMGDSLPAVALGTGRTAVALTAGEDHTCASLDDATVKCWGRDGNGQLGLGDILNRGDAPGEMGDSLPAVALGTGRTAVAVTAGGFHTCALLDDGSVKCWGSNNVGQLGLGGAAERGDEPGEMGDALPTLALGTRRTAVSIAAGEAHTCALLDHGTVKCWGNNVVGQSGLGDTLNRGDGPGEMGESLPAVALGTGRTAVAITAGQAHTCALLDDATVKCWGSNWEGSLGLGEGGPTTHRGDGPGEMGDSLPAVALGTGRTAVAITAGQAHTCALLDDATVKCWGLNEVGGLGLGDIARRGDGAGEMGDSLPAVDLGAGRTAVAIAAGWAHSCALLDDATVRCWGYNEMGSLGLGDTLNRGDGAGEMGDSLPAVDLGAGRTAVAIAAGGAHTCALLDDATVKCWGANGDGRLGLGDTLNRGDGAGEMGDALPAVALGAGRTAVAITAGGAHTCALLDDATAKCWGDNREGRLGLGDTLNRGDGAGEMGDSLPAVALGTGRTVVAITAGWNGSCALLDYGTVRCWGYNGEGQLGLGDILNRGDQAGEMGDSLPAVALSDSLGGAPVRAAVVRLAPGTYQFRIVALNSTGESAPSGASAPVTVTPMTVPGAPSGVAGTPGNGQAALSWLAPVSTGGSAITNYRVSVFSGAGGAAIGVTGATTRFVGSPVANYSFTGLSNGTGYRFRVAALNAVGMGTASGLSAAVVPRTVPGAPSSVVGTPGSGRVALTWLAPVSTGGSPITNYQVSVYNSAGGVATGVTGVTTRLVGSPVANYSFTGLSNGTGYRFRVAALNAVGTGTASAFSATVIAGSPAPPTGLKAVSGSTITATGSLVVSFVAGANNGSVITGYTASCVSSDGGVTGVMSGTASPLTVSGLTTAKTYTCTARGTNARGAGTSTGPSAAVIVGSPAAPTAVRAVSGSTITATGSLLVSFTPGASNGSVITGYTASCVSSDGGVTGATSGLASPLTVAGLTTAKTYRCTVKAANARGSGVSSLGSFAVIVGSPAAPTAVKAVAGPTTSSSALTGPLVVSFTAGADNGSVITGYTASCVSSDGGVTGTRTGIASPLTVTGLTIANSYTCTVRAANARGSGLSSVGSLAVIVGSPAAPTAVTAVRVAAGQLRVSFTAGANNTSVITGYTATCVSSNGGVTGTSAGTASPLTVTGLTTGKTYTCTTKATNARGTGLASTPSAALVA